MKRRSLIGSILIACAALPALAESNRPNIIYILADDLGYDELGCYGQKRIQTPHIDRIAREGMRFTQHYSGAAVCAPSRYTLLTGKHIGRSHTPGQGQRLPDGETTLGTVMKRAGYRTAAFGKWGLGDNPNEQGFDEWLGFLDQGRAHFFYPEWVWKNTEQLKFPENIGLRKEGAYGDISGGTYIHDVFTDSALDFIRQSQAEPFFLYLPYTIPHAEFVVPEDSLAAYAGCWPEHPEKAHKTVLDPAKGKRGIEGGTAFYDGYGYCSVDKPNATYAAMVSRMDRDVGQIMALLKELGLDDNTLVLFASDNGPTFIPGYNREFFEVPESFPFSGHKGSLEEGGIRIPFVARWPGRIAAGSVTDHLSYFPDILPTFAKLAGVEVSAPIDGTSLLPVLLNQPDRIQQAPYLYWQKGDAPVVRLGEYKGFFKQDKLMKAYSINEDIGEKNDITNQLPSAIRTQMEEIVQSVLSKPKHPAAKGKLK
ncbi:arylsulfatase [Pontiella sulfatireligans]|uniref:Arylsulfatase n=1 Tax=Pontiella sulfatireligans TaxID=2750658 RepID=A0A6C2URR8_9BACT|nr:arylsulfatase [Pontiella sulfatireligans]SPS74538.1 sulfatase S1_20 [Kiritimatiellales bacterium]VGO22948.1 Arylsulfatase [Pontiella sulfatireligans]